MHLLTLKLKSNNEHIVPTLITQLVLGLNLAHADMRRRRWTNIACQGKKHWSSFFFSFLCHQNLTTMTRILRCFHAWRCKVSMQVTLFINLGRSQPIEICWNWEKENQSESQQNWPSWRLFSTLLSVTYSLFQELGLLCETEHLVDWWSSKFSPSVDWNHGSKVRVSARWEYQNGSLFL